MPAQGRGNNLKLPVVEPPKVLAPSKVFSGPLPQQPFAPAQRQAQHRVEHTQAALPKQPTPNIPRLANPTRAQSEAALTLARNHARQAGVPAQKYWTELKNDPRQREYVGTVEHYARSLKATEAQRVGLKVTQQQSMAPQETLSGLGHERRAYSEYAARSQSEQEWAKLPLLQQLQKIGEGALSRPGGPEAKPLPKPKPAGDVLAAIGASNLGAELSNPLTLGANALATILGQKSQGVGGAAAQKGLDVGEALANNPERVAVATAKAIPETLNALVTGTGRLAAEATLEGKPGLALDQLAKSISRDYSNRYGHLGKQDRERIEKEGILPELLDASLLVGGPGSVVGRGLSKGVEATGYGATDFAALAARRAAEEQAAHAAPYAAVPIAPALSKGAKLRATIHEAATQPRPLLRTGPGVQRPSVAPGSILKPQERSPNLFRALPQTALDNARRDRALKGLQIQQAITDHLNQGGLHAQAPRARPVQPLAKFTGPGEVSPLMQGGDNASRFPGKAFFGAAKQQRVGTSGLKGGAVEMRSAEAGVLKPQFEKALKELTPEQRTLLTHAKEGLIPLHDPAEAVRWLKEAHAQASAGSHGGQNIGLLDKLAGSDVAKELGGVLKHIEKHGAESVFTPKFEELAHAIPDSRLTQHRDPTVSADAASSRAYRPQMQQVRQFAERHPDHALSDQTIAATDQIKLLEDQGGKLRKGDVSGTPEARAVEAAVAAQKAAEDGLRHAVSGREKGSAKEVGPTTPAAVAEGKVKVNAAKTARISAEKDLKVLRTEPHVLHERAANHYATAHNLANEVALMHGLPTDRAYVLHTKRFTDSNMVHTVGSGGPRVQHQMEGILQREGHRSLDPHLILNSLLSNIRNDYKVRFLKPFHDKYNAAPEGLTAHEATEWMREHGLEDHYAVAHLGRLGARLKEDGSATHLAHFNLDAHAHADRTASLLDQAMGPNVTSAGDHTPGAGVYPKAAINELKGVFSTPSTPGRILGKLKGAVSSLMLGTSLPWLTTMSAGTYPIQSLYAGAGPVSLAESIHWYKGFTASEKATIDHWFGVDSPFEKATHGLTTERLGAAAPKGRAFEELAKITDLAKNYPLTKALAKGRPDHLILRMERVPRRYSRINATFKGVKTQAIREMLRETRGAMAEQSKIANTFARLQHFGRQPAAKYMDMALKNTTAMEKHAQHLNNVMGEWKNTTQYERNILGRMVLFYPWVRYSVKLAAKTLPVNHPLSYALALKYATIQHEYLHELLGTEPTPGNIYLGPEQSNVEPEKRKFSVIGARQTNPLANTVIDLLGARSPGQTLAALPPYMSDLIEYAVGKNLFTDKALKGADKGEAELKAEHRPSLFGFALNRAIAVTNPGRTAMKVLSKGAPQSDESVPWNLKPVQYSAKTENKILREQKEHHEAGTGGQLLNELLPLRPHSDEGKLEGKIRIETKEAKVQAKKERKEGHVAVPLSESQQLVKERRESLEGGEGGGETAQLQKERREVLAGVR